jgi:molecular chaperone HscB
MSQAQTTSATPCWNCQAETNGAHFCPACGKIQPLPRGTDYFAFFAWPQKLRLDPAELERRFHQLSWKLHPDNFVRAGDYERNLSLERSSQLNDAYRTLRDPVRRVEYLLLRHGLRKEGTTKQQAPPELLQEVFELNEWLDQLRLLRSNSLATGDGDLAEVRARLQAAAHNFQKKLAEVDAELEHLFAEWDAAADRPNEAIQQKLLARMNEILNRRSYIRNLVSNVTQELAED